MVAGEVDFHLRITRVGGIGITVDDILQCRARFLGFFLVAADIGDLHIVAQGHQVVRIRRAGAGRVQLYETVEDSDGIIELARAVRGIGCHDFRVRCPFGGRILALYFFELFDGGFVFFLGEGGERLVVQLGERFVGFGGFVGFVFFAIATSRQRQQGGYHCRCECGSKKDRRNPHVSLIAGWLPGAMAQRQVSTAVSLGIGGYAARVNAMLRNRYTLCIDASSRALTKNAEISRKRRLGARCARWSSAHRLRYRRRCGNSPGPQTGCAAAYC